MAAQLCSEFGSIWPSDQLGRKLPPLKRVVYNHAVLRVLKEKQAEHDPNAAAANPSPTRGASATANVRARRAKTEESQRKMLEEYERRVRQLETRADATPPS